jgi:hypothetical protein
VTATHYPLQYLGTTGLTDFLYQPHEYIATRSGGASDSAVDFAGVERGSVVPDRSAGDAIQGQLGVDGGRHGLAGVDLEFDVPVTTRNWNTIMAVVRILKRTKT